MYIPYYPTKWETVKLLRKILEIPYKAKVIDLGSGGGRIIYGLASEWDDIELYGVEKNPLLVNASRRFLRRRGVEANILRGDLFKVNLNRFDIAYGYLTPEALDILRPKIRDFISRDKIFISFDFKIPELKPSIVLPVKELGINHRLYLYGKMKELDKIFKI